MLIKQTLYGLLALALWGAGVMIPAYADDDKPVEPAPLPQGFSGTYLSGQFARAHGDAAGAIDYLRKVHHDDPKNADLTGQLEGLMLLQGKIDEAIALAGDMPAESRDQLSSLLLVLAEVKKNNAEEASAFLNDISDGSNPQLWQPLIGAWLDVSRHKLAKPMTLQDFTADVGRAAPLVDYHLALINASAGFKDVAAQNFKDAIEDPKNPPGRVIGQLLAFYHKNGQPPLLAPIVKAYSETYPEFARQADLPMVETMQDGVAEVLYTMGGIMLAAGVNNDAAIYLQLTLYLKPDLSEAALALGDSYNELQQYARSNEMYAHIPAASRFYEKAQLHMAVNAERMGKLDDALAMLDNMSKAMPTASDALITKGDLLRVHQRYPEAVAAYSEGLKRTPQIKADYWPVLFARGACLERLGKWSEAESDLRQALTFKPNQPDILNYLGYGMLEHHENMPEAREMIATAVKARPDDAQIVDSMGWALYLQGDYAGATEYMEKAVELLPGDATVNDHLGDVYWRAGRKTEARYQWERSLMFSPEASMADSIHKKLKDGLPPTALAEPLPPIHMPAPAESSASAQSPAATATP
jgi:tetratricopeptide (TPR) repeat protein